MNRTGSAPDVASAVADSPALPISAEAWCPRLIPGLVARDYLDFCSFGSRQISLLEYDRAITAAPSRQTPDQIREAL